MCLVGIKFLRSSNGKFHLTVAANRDERHDRPAAAAAWWSDYPGIFAGKDLVADGTWLGATAGGRFAAVTNVRSPATIGAEPAPMSRGDITLQFLAGTESGQSFCENLIQHADAYGGFNFVAWDGQELWWCCNQGQPAQQLKSGVYAVSNGSLNSPWPKSRALAGTLETVQDVRPLLAALRNSEVPNGQLPNTGVGPELERRLAPAFILGTEYGTRCSTVITLDSTGGHFTEVSFDRTGAEIRQVSTSLNARESERRH
ncbi:MAG: NRDE family protein [Lysobacterales bacterium]